MEWKAREETQMLLLASLRSATGSNFGKSQEFYLFVVILKRWQQGLI